MDVKHLVKKGYGTVDFACHAYFFGYLVTDKKRGLALTLTARETPIYIEACCDKWEQDGYDGVQVSFNELDDTYYLDPYWAARNLTEAMMIAAIRQQNGYYDGSSGTYYHLEVQDET